MTRPAQAPHPTPLEDVIAVLDRLDIAYEKTITLTTSGGHTTLVVTSDTLGGCRDFYLQLVFDADGELIRNTHLPFTPGVGTGLWE